MRYESQEFVGGKWAKASELSTIKRAKIINEVKPVPGRFLNDDGSVKMQDVAKVMFEGLKEPLNVNLNKATISGLIKAFGNDSAHWVNKPLSVETEKMRVAGKAVTALYLIPSGFELVNDDEGYAKIQSIGAETEQPAVNEEIPVVQVEEETPDISQVPF